MKVFKMIIIGSFLLLCVAFGLNSAIVANESCSTFTLSECKLSGNGEDSSDKSSTQSGRSDRLNGLNYSPSLGQLIVEGGGFSLDSQSYMASLLNQVEWSELRGVDYSRLQDTLYNAISNMLNANDRYYYLYLLSLRISYNEAVVHMLVNFDYDGFMKESSLNPVLFREVKRLLSCGDVRGVYRQLYLKTAKILRRLEDLRGIIELNSLPQISKLWRLNQEYAEFGLFGQYVAEVFYRIHGMQ